MKFKFGDKVRHKDYGELIFICTELRDIRYSVVLHRGNEQDIIWTKDLTKGWKRK